MKRLAALAVLLFVAISCATFAQSQPPSPRPAQRGGQQQQSAPAQAQTQPANDPRGTNETPLFVQVKPTPKTDDETAKEQKEEEREATAEWWDKASVWLTGLLGVLQLGVIGFQIYIARVQNSIIQRQSRIMVGQRRAADRQTKHMLEGLEHSRISAEANRTSADAIKSLHTQWITTEAVSAEIQAFDGGGPPAPRHYWFRVQCNFSNRTDRPLTLVEALVFDLNKQDGSFSSYNLGNYVQVPGDTIPIDLNIQVTEDDIARSLVGVNPDARLIRQLIAMITFVDAFGDTKEQWLGWSCSYRPEGTEFTRAHGALMEAARRRYKNGRYYPSGPKAE